MGIFKFCPTGTIRSARRTTSNAPYRSWQWTSRAYSASARYRRMGHKEEHYLRTSKRLFFYSVMDTSAANEALFEA